MDIVSAFNSPVLLTIDGVEVSFPRLSPPEVAIECNRIKAGKISQARRLATEFGINGLDALKLVRQAEDEEPTVNALWIEVCAPQAALDVLVKSLKKSGKTEVEAKAILETIDTEKSIETALAVTGWKAPEEDDDATKKKIKKAADKAAKQTEEAVGFKR